MSKKAQPESALRSARERAGLRQEQAGPAVGRTARTWRRWENDASKIPIELLPLIAAVLRVNPHDREALWGQTLGISAAEQETDPLRRIPGWVILLRVLPWPAYMIDPAMNILVMNRQLRRALPYLPRRRRPHVVRDLLLHPDAPHYLMDWERSWATPIVRFVYANYLARPRDARLRDLAVEMAEQPRLRPVWEAHVEQRGEPLAFPDTEIRRLRHPAWGRSYVEVMSAVPGPLLREVSAALVVWRRVSPRSRRVCGH